MCSAWGFLGEVWEFSSGYWRFPVFIWERGLVGGVQLRPVLGASLGLKPGTTIIHECRNPFGPVFESCIWNAKLTSFCMGYFNLLGTRVASSTGSNVLLKQVFVGDGGCRRLTRPPWRAGAPDPTRGIGAPHTKRGEHRSQRKPTQGPRTHAARWRRRKTMNARIA